MAEYRDIPDISKQLEKNLKRLPLILCEDIGLQFCFNLFF